jgi:MoxR-like ATPase
VTPEGDWLVDLDFGSYPAAMTEMGSAATLGDLLASRRRRRFVGRASEVELFRVALESPEPPFLLLHIHGPPGIGKTRLLDV